MSRTPCRSPRSRGFTLVELLAVLAIVTVLAAVLIPTVGRARKSALRGRTQTDVGTLLRAFQMYYVEYDEWPEGLMGGDTGPDVESTNPGIEFGSNVVVMLRGTDVSGSNPGNSQFLDIPLERLRKDGVFCDPWGSPYRYMCDFNYDGTVRVLNRELPGEGQLDEKGVAVWSLGPDQSDAPGRQADDITSWRLPKK
jgi:prepilin-type N-terminal cleavage/methylation domain-containing protein